MMRYLIFSFRGFFLGVLGLFAISCFACTLFASNAHAAASDRFSGWAWSEAIGWISFNCTDVDVCDDSNYGVTMTSNGGATESLSGWAWSENIGWIDFSEGIFTNSTGALSGTALVYSTSVDPYDEGGSEDDDWDGIIDLAATSPVAFGPVWDSTDNTSDGWDWNDTSYYLLDGFSWGDENIGWIKFSCQDSDGGGDDTNTCGTVGFGVYVDPLLLSFSADDGLTSGDPVANDASYNHIWSVSPVSEVVSCTASGGPGDWSDVPNKSFSPAPTYGNVTGALGSATSTLSCLHTGGKVITKSVYIYVLPAAPSLTFTALDDNIGYESSTTLQWTTLNADTCTLTGPGTGSPAYSETQVATGSAVTITSGSLSDATNDFLLKCTSPYPEYTGIDYIAYETVNVEKLGFDFYAEDSDGERLTSGDLVAYSSRASIALAWDLEFASGGCTASGDWSGVKDSTDGLHEEVALIPESGSFSFTLQCDGSGEQTAQGTVTIKLGKNPDFSEEITNDLEQ